MIHEKGRPASEAYPAYVKSIASKEKEELEVYEAIIELANAQERWERATNHLTGIDRSTKARDFINKHTAYRTAFKAAAADLDLEL